MPVTVYAIHEAAEALVSMPGAPDWTHHEYITKLVDLVKEDCLEAILSFRSLDKDGNYSTPDIHSYFKEQNAFVAATFLNIVPVVKSLAEDMFSRYRTFYFSTMVGSWFDYKIVLGSPFDHAARQGHVDTVKLLIPHLEPHNSERLRMAYFAVGHGHPQIVDIVLEGAHLPAFHAGKSQRPRPQDMFAFPLQESVFRLWEECARVPNRWEKRMPKWEGNEVWIHSILAGNITALEGMLGSRIKIANRNTGNLEPVLRLACRISSPEIVQVLLDHIKDKQNMPIGLVRHAAAGGNMVMIRWLLSMGHDINGKEPFALNAPVCVSAILLEDTAMFWNLRDNGAEWNEAVITEAVGKAKYARLESMLEFIQSSGVDIDKYPATWWPRASGQCDRCDSAAKAKQEA